MWLGPRLREDDGVFDRGFIGFEDNGDVLVSPVAHAASPVKLRVAERR